MIGVTVPVGPFTEKVHPTSVTGRLGFGLRSPASPRRVCRWRFRLTGRSRRWVHLAVCRSSRIGRPAIPRYRDVHPRAVVQCASTRDVARAVAYARVTGTHVVPRGGGHCFAGRSSTKGLMLDLGRLDTVTVNVDGLATIGAGRAAGPGVRRTARARADHPSRLRPDGRHRRTHRGRRARPARSPARADLRCAGRRTGGPRRRTTRGLRRGPGARAVLGASRAAGSSAWSLRSSSPPCRSRCGNVHFIVTTTLPWARPWST